MYSVLNCTAPAYPYGTIVTYVQGTSTLATFTSADRSVSTYEELDGQADDTDTPLEPFFVSELSTPPSDSYVDESGAVYTTISISYSHQFSHASRAYTEDNPRVSEAGDVSDILWPAVDARLRCKWSRLRVETAECEYYTTSVEAVFMSYTIPDEDDFEILRPLVTGYL